MSLNFNPQKRALLDKLLERQQSKGAVGKGAIEARSKHESIPLSHAQEGLWLLDQLDPGSSTYNISLALRLQGALDSLALRRAHADLVQRHEVFRCHFVEKDGVVRQIVDPTCTPEIEFVSLAHLPREQQESECQHRCKMAAMAHFDLSRDSLLRVLVMDLGGDQHIILLCTHHIVSDGWSMDLLVDEFGKLYSWHSGTSGRRPGEPVLQYGDFAIWERNTARSEQLEVDREYWKTKLAGAPPVIPLRTDCPRPLAQSHRGGLVELRIDPDLRTALIDLSRQAQVSLFMTLMAAFQVLLARFSQSHDILVGTPMANRNRPELQGLIGLFVNSVVIRGDTSGDPPFIDFLRQIRETCLEAHSHQRLPFGRVVEAVQPPRDLSYSPIFQVMFTLVTASAEPGVFGGLSMSSYLLPLQVSAFDLTLTAEERTDGIQLSAEYASDIFEAETIARLLSHYVTLLQGIVRAPSTRVGELPLLSGEERVRLLQAWNQTQANYPDQTTYAQEFERQVRATPDAVAVAQGSLSLTYAELNARANGLARYLNSLGVGPEVIVGICLDRGLDLAVGLLGILKSGGAYLPLDPAYPSERLAHLIQDAEPRVILSHRSHTSVLPVLGDTASTLVCLDDRAVAVSLSAGCTEDNPPEQAGPDNLAYVIYTSGSTGKPKGVQITHRALLNHNTAVARLYGLMSSDRVLQFASLNFDIAVEEFFPTWLNGCALVLRTDEAISSIRRFFEFIAQERITLMNLPTAFWHTMVVEMKDNPLPPCVRCVIIGGEACSPPRFSEWHQRLTRPVKLFNAYGPTESTVTATVFAADTPRSEGIVPIGRPIANVRAYVLDGRLQPVPVGVPGELYLAGAGLARGYLHAPELTDRRFLVDIHATNLGERMYKTGDQARWLADGNLEFLGRTDSQVKIRGYRIEPAEVESHLSNHPQVASCAVLPKSDATGAPMLAAYLVPREGEHLSVNALRQWLGSRVPDHLIPQAFVSLPVFPLTPNGKVDRKALSSIEGEQLTLGSDYVEPRTAAERQMVEVWRQVLQIESIGIDDNFFALGGHSLQAVQVVSRVRDAYKVEISLRHLFENPTVARFTQQVSQLQEKACDATPGISILAESGPHPASFAQQRLWFLERLEDQGTAYHIETATRLRGPLDCAAVELAINAIVARHESLRTGFVEVDGTLTQVIEPSVEFAVPVEVLARKPEQSMDSAIGEAFLHHLERRFDLSRPPLLRAVLLRITPEDHILLQIFHHLIADDWSLRVFDGELEAFYKSFSRRTSPGLATLPLRYVDYARWQQESLKKGELERQLEYWRRELANAPGLEMPTDHPRPAQETHTGAHQSFSLSKETTQRLEEFNQTHGVTPFMSLLGAFQVLLARYTRQEDFLIGTPIANRQRQELEPLVGFFINTVVLRADLSARPGFAEVVARAKRAALGAYEHQDLPFDKLVEEINPVRDLSRHPLFQVAFTVEEPLQTLCLDGVEATPFPMGSSATQFDLDLSLQLQGDHWVGTLTYSTSLYEAGTIQRLAGHFVTLLDGLLSDPLRSIWGVPLLTESERSLLLFQWNQTRAEYPHRCIHHLVSEQARRTPDAVALRCASTQATYRELEDRADRLSAILRKRMAKPGCLVGICLERSVEMVTALLAVLKAGAAYVPLSPSLPKRRLADIVQDSGVSLIVTQSKVFASLSLLSTPTVVLDQVAAQPGAEMGSVDLSAEATAYLMYTSGSTGKPKGVAISHRSLSNCLHHFQKSLHFTQNDVWFAVSSLSFDISGLEIWLPLISGGTCVLATDETTLDGHLLLESLAASGATVMQATPATWQMLLLSGWKGDRNLQVLCGGEPMPQDLAASLARSSKVAWNVYGPTETTIWSTERRLCAGVPVDIGLPIANTKVFIVDDHNQVVPIGVAGHLLLGGDGLAIGYHQRPELTQEKFFEFQVSDSLIERCYRTGDLARWLPGGNIELLGRIDSQVKIRGFRIELGEIESCARTLLGVSDAAVVVCDDPDRGKVLVAYVVTSEGRPFDGNQAGTILSTQLPHYMLPTAYFVLPRLPTTPNGKINRKELAEQARLDLRHLQVPAGDDQLTQPRDEIESYLVTLWIELLGLSKVGIRENFFELGGHSLIAIKMFARLKDHYRLDLRLALLFESPTIEKLAATLRDRLSLSNPVMTCPDAHLAPLDGGDSARLDEPKTPRLTCIVPIKQSGTYPPLYAVHGIGGTVLEYAQIAKHLAPEQPFYGIESLGLVDSSMVNASIKTMAERYVADILAVQPQGPYYLCGSSFGGIIAYTMAQVLMSQGHQVAFVGLFDSHGNDYPKPIPTRQAVRRAVDRLLYRIHLHFTNFRLLDTRAKLSYLALKSRTAVRRCGIKWRALKRRVHAGLQMARVDKVLRRQATMTGENPLELQGIRVPKLLRKVQDNAMRESDSAILEPYAGKLTLFRAEKQPFGIVEDPTSGWGALVPELEIHIVPGHHGAIVREPHVRSLTSILTRCLECARKAGNAISGSSSAHSLHFFLTAWAAL